jgi:hypothetical protein
MASSRLDDLPVSSSYPDLVMIPRALRGEMKLLPGKAHSYQNNGDSVVFYEFRGRGVLPVDVGRPGDVYWDVKLPYIIYFGGIAGW